MRAAIEQFENKIWRGFKYIQGVLDRVLVIRLPQRQPNAIRASKLIDKLCPNATPQDILVTWITAIVRRGKNPDKELHTALAMTSGADWDSMQWEYGYNRFNRQMKSADMVETIAVQRINQTDEQIKDAKEKSALRALRLELGKIPTDIQSKVFEGILEKLATEPGSTNASGN